MKMRRKTSELAAVTNPHKEMNGRKIPGEPSSNLN
jgi:hypothetical protein